MGTASPTDGPGGPEPPTEPVPLRRLVALARPERRLLAAGLLFLLLGGATALVWPQAVRRIVDEALAADSDASLARLNRTAIGLLVIFLVQSVAVALRFYLFAIAGERIVLRLRQSLYGALVRQEIAFFDTRRTGELLSRLTADSTAVQTALTNDLSNALRCTLLVIGGTGMLLWTSPLLTLWMLAVVPPVMIGAIVLGRRIRSVSREAHDALAEAGHAAEESLAGIRTVRAFAREDREERRYGSAVTLTFDLYRRRARAVGGFMSIAFFAAYGSVALVFWNGGRMVVQGDMSIGDLTAFLLYTLTVAVSITGLGELWTSFARARGASERVFGLIDREPAMDRSEGDELTDCRGAVAFEGVGFAYPSRPDVGVLADVSFGMEPGEVVALVGPSGSGKSTIAGLLMRFYDPHAGVVRVDGRDVRELAPDALRRRISTVAQEPILFSTSITENVRYGREEATDAEVETACRAANAHDFVTTFPEGYETQVGERGVRLSAGQKQRVAIARALIRDPRILILDEATSALDAESEHLVQQALEHLMEGRTTLVIAHRLSTVRRADRVLVVEGGRIVEEGPHADLVRAGGLYARLVERQLA